MGNSEVGHLNIGGGRIVQQELTRINAAVTEKKLARLGEMEKLFSALKHSPSSALHLLGLVSEGGVHSSLAHLIALIQASLENGLRKIYVHAITDGRDRPPTASLEELGELQAAVANWKQEFPEAEVGVVSVVGRYFAMDRDKRWERTELAYDLFTEMRGELVSDPLSALAHRHAQGETDEFIKPMRIEQTDFSRSTAILDGDCLLFFNFRADRMRQIVRSFFDSNFKEFRRKVYPKARSITTLTEYESDFPVEVLFRPQVVKNHLGEVLSEAGLSQLRIAETEKYAHVTYFFNGGVEAAYPGETRALVPSPRDVATYDLKPEMSAEAVTEKLLEVLRSKAVDVFILNFANCDMVGHTGNFNAAVRAVETVDRCLGRILKEVEMQGGAAIVTADHGNADQMIDYTTGAPHTFHTTYPVPLIIVGDAWKGVQLREGGALCDIAPTICHMLGVKTPIEMTGETLIEF